MYDRVRTHILQSTLHHTSYERDVKPLNGVETVEMCETAAMHETGKCETAEQVETAEMCETVAMHETGKCETAEQVETAEMCETAAMHETVESETAEMHWTTARRCK